MDHYNVQCTAIYLDTLKTRSTVRTIEVHDMPYESRISKNAQLAYVLSQVNEWNRVALLQLKNESGILWHYYWGPEVLEEA